MILNKIIPTVLVILISSRVLSQNSTTELQEFKNYDFISGTKILFEEHYQAYNASELNGMWKLEGGKLDFAVQDKDKCLSVKEYYTKFSPKLSGVKILPDNFTVEYDTWLDAGYDGNPGIEIHFIGAAEKEVIVTPNKHEMTCVFPGDGRENKENPEAYFGENKFYNRWVHISISFVKKRLQVYLDQYKMIDVADCRLLPNKIIVTGNTSQDMKILLKNFRVTTGIPVKQFDLVNGKFVTHAIRFDVNKSVIKPESMSVLNEVVKFMQENAAINFEIGGHTDSDGDDVSNIKLSKERAEAVKVQLVKMGISETRLKAMGYGETKPINPNTTFEGKANNRRVEFIKI